jgi:poly-gamma-glutamate synthesis protein (capsule biosynthesis protein)
MTRGDITVVVGGDLYAAGCAARGLQAGDAAAVFYDLLPELQLADYAVVNLEAPLIDTPSPITKSGPVLAAHPHVVRGLKSGGIRAVNLANNHILDHGERGLKRTLEACQEVGIESFGAGPDLASASRWLIKDMRGLRIAFVGMAEREFSIASRDSYGANPLDTIDFRRAAREHRNHVDYLVALVHGGAEHYPFPTPQLQKTCRFLVEEGASAVICQHSHCPGTCEFYRGAPIVYGQGNLLFEARGRRLPWYQGFLVKLLFPQQGGTLCMEMIPYRQSYGQLGTRRMCPSDSRELLREIEQRSVLLGDERSIEWLWRGWAVQFTDDFLGCLLGYGRIRAALNRRLKFASRLFSKRAAAALLDFCRCASNRAALEVILEDLRAEKDYEPRDGHLRPPGERSSAERALYEMQAIARTRAD